MNSTYRTRQAVAADVESVVALERGMENAPHWTVADYLAALSPLDAVPGVGGTRRCFFVAEAGPVLAGFCVGRVAVLDGTAGAEVESVGVADWARRAGVGRALCQAAIEWACAEGAREIELEVRSMSDGAIALLSRNGVCGDGKAQELLPRTGGRCRPDAAHDCA